MLNNPILAYLLSDDVLPNLGYTAEKWEQLIQAQKAVLHGGNAFLTAIQKHGGGSGVEVNFS